MKKCVCSVIHLVNDFYLVLVQESLVNDPGRTLDHLVDPLAMAYTFVSLLVGHDSLALAAVGHLVIAHCFLVETVENIDIC